MDDLEDVDPEGVLRWRLVLRDRDLVEQDLPRERVLEVDLDWRRGHLRGRTRDCGTAGAGPGGSGTTSTGGSGPRGVAGTSGFAGNIGVIGERGVKFRGVLLPCEGVAESSPDGEYD